MSKRYIDADALIELLHKKVKIDYEMGVYNHAVLTESFIRFVEKQPTTDVVEVVRCRECKYCRTLKDGGSQCERIDGLLMTKPDDYCSYGERKEE